MKSIIKYIIACLLIISLIGAANAELCGGSIQCNCNDIVIGNYNLPGNLTCQGNGLIIGESSITINCNGHSINGSGLGYGIHIQRRKKVVIKNCNIFNFDKGVYIESVPSGETGSADTNVIQDSNISNNKVGVHIHGCGCGDSHADYNAVKRNNIFNNTNQGVYISGYARNNKINSDIICSNGVDIYNAGTGSSGSNNTCDTTNNWNDNNKTGCSYICLPCEDKDNDGYGVCPACNTTHECRSNGNDCDDNSASIIPAIDNLNVNKSLTICKNSYNINDTAQDGVIIINSSDVVLDCNNATLNGAGSGYGIYLENKSNVTIKNCNVMNYYRGVYLNFSSNNTITNNTANSNNWDGIYLYNSNLNNISNNNISNNNIGIQSVNSNSTINSNYVCSNMHLDFNSSDWKSSSGDNNACDKSGEWSDAGINGCFYTCSGLPRICDLNHDGIIISGWNDLIFAYKCFLGINKNCNDYYQKWNLIQQEYNCFMNNN